MDTRRTVSTLAASLAVVALAVSAPAARADDATSTPTPAGTSTGTTAAATTSAPPTTTAATTSATTTTTPPTTAAPAPAVIGRGAPVSQVKDLQVRLKLVGQFAYAITGVYWSAVDSSVLAFQRAHGLAENGVVDQPTWDRLRALTNTPVAVTRTARVSQVKDLQIRLKLVRQFTYAITGVYWSAVDRSVLTFQLAHNLPQSGVVDQRTWDRLRALTNTPVAIPRTAAAVRVKDLQVRLKLVRQFTYAITGVYWSAVDRSVLTFQLTQNLPQSGVVDQRTWDRLRTLTATPVAIGRTSGTARIREAQLRLRAVGRWNYAITGVYWSALDRAVLAFQQQGNLPQSGVIDTRTWSRLLALTHLPGTFDQRRYTAGLRPLMPTIGSLDSRCRTGRVMCVDKATRTLTWVVDGKPLMVMWARFGGPGRETREGTFRVSRKYEYVISNLYFTPMPYSMFFSGGQAVHYSSNFARLGYASSSHGCVNIGDHALVKSLFFKVRVGDKVVVYH